MRQTDRRPAAVPNTRVVKDMELYLDGGFYNSQVKSWAQQPFFTRYELAVRFSYFSARNRFVRFENLDFRVYTDVGRTTEFNLYWALYPASAPLSDAAIVALGQRVGTTRPFVLDVSEASIPQTALTRDNVLVLAFYWGNTSYYLNTNFDVEMFRISKIDQDIRI